MIVIANVRKDYWGDGSFGAKRGERTHKGVDFDVMPYSEVLSFTSGYVSKLGWAYDISHPTKGEYRYVEVLQNNGHRIRYFYVSPLVKIGQDINKLSVIGISQDISKAYDDRMHPHVHLEVINPEGEHIDPHKYLDF